MHDTATATNTVMVVDDNPQIRALLSKFLHEAGYRVRTASNGHEALSLLSREGNPAVMLLDLVMPQLSGWQTLEAMAENPSWDTIPVVVMSSSTVTPPAGHRFLSKPFELQQLLAAVQNCRTPAVSH